MKAHELIDTPEKWVNGFPWSLGTNCAVTAIYEAYHNDVLAIREAIRKLKIGINSDYVTSWNDRSTWETVYGTLKNLDI